MRYHAAKKYAVRILPILFWLGVWQLVSMGVGQPILLVSPLTALDSAALVGTGTCYAPFLQPDPPGFTVRLCRGVLGTLAFRFVALGAALPSYLLSRPPLWPPS